MVEQIEVETLRIWDAADKETNEAAALKIVLPDFKPKSYGSTLSGGEEREISTKIWQELQPVADKHFGRGRVRVSVTQIEFGSLEILLTLVMVGGPLYVFFKDYEDFRKGLLSFIKDVKILSPQLKKHVSNVLNKVINKGHTERKHQNRN